jgi:hypothetical protein
MTPHDRFRLAIAEFGVREACYWFGQKDPTVIKQCCDAIEEFLNEQTRMLLEEESRP